MYFLFFTLFFIEFINGYFFYKIFDRTNTKKKSIIIYVALSIITSIGCCLLYYYCNELLYVLITLFVLRLIYIAIIKKKLLKVLYLMLIQSLLEISLYLFVISLINNLTFDYSISFIFDYSSLITVCVYVLLETYLVYMVYKLTTKEVDIKITSILFFILVTVVLYILDIFLFYNYIISKNESIKMLFVLFVIFTILVSVLMVNDLFLSGQKDYYKNENKLLLLKNEMLIESEKRNQEMFDLWKKSIHDYKHNIIALQEWTKDGDLIKIKEFLDDEFHLVDNKLINYNTGNSILDSILASKQTIAEARGVKYFANVIIDKKIDIEDRDLVCLMGNLLDNAIESAEQTEKPFVNIVINLKQDILLIKINNSYCDENIGNNKNKKEDYFHGLGVKSIKDIVKKYKGNYEQNYGEGIVNTLVYLNA